MRVSNTSEGHVEGVVDFTFKASEFFLVHSNPRNMGQEWTLNRKIDRSEKGKDEDIGIEVIYLTDEEAEEAKAVGFDVVEM